jgi:peptidoglycan hydrolase-like protein with peptidoglycan-binding domain
MIIQNTNKIILALALLIFLAYSTPAKAVLLNENVNFNIDAAHTTNNKKQVEASLVKFTSKVLFYVEKSWWEAQTYAQKADVITNLDSLSVEFENKIYPTLTSTFGSEPKPGIDGDEKITVLFHQMKDDSGGYFRSADEYFKAQVSDSNEREMLYLPTLQINSNQLKMFLAHEFVHLISFNQKNKIFNVDDETWLNEGRAEYVATLLGYDNVYIGSNLQRRVNAFLEKPTDSLVEWNDTKYDYAVVNVFLHYLVDHYGINTLIDSLKSKYVGIESINYALRNNGSKDDFSKIFSNWTVATIINDCTVNERYCYLDENLKKLKINSTLNFLPLAGNSSLSVTNITKNWSGNWQKIVGGNGELTLEFAGLTGFDFKVPYIIYDKDNKSTVNFLILDKNQKATINVSGFGSKNNALVILPSLQTKTSGFDGFEFNYPYTFTVSVKEQTSIDEQDLIKQLLEKIAYLKAEIARIIAQRSGQVIDVSKVCSGINTDLYLGIYNKEQVSCLQSFLKLQGTEIYPEALITGIFGNLTQQAVIKFQEKYASEILTPSNLVKGTGYVGLKTRFKINQLLSAK